MYFRASIASKLYLHKKSGCDKNVHDHGNKKKNSRDKKYKEDPLDDQKEETVLDQFEPITLTSYTVYLLDPIIRAFCCGMSCFNCTRYKHQNELMECSDEKFSQELEVSTLLKKVRTSYAVIRNIISKKHRSLIDYHHDHLVCLDPDSSHTERSYESDGELGTGKDKDQNVVNRQFFQAIIKGLDIDKETKKKLVTMAKGKDKGNIWEVIGTTAGTSSSRKKEEGEKGDTPTKSPHRVSEQSD